jgi:hypothetical protein
MWWTSEGERVLHGAEWDLFREGLSSLWDEVEVSEEEDGPGSTGIAVFDELPKAERLAFLATVAKGLTDQDEPCPDLRALTEGTAAAIFAHIRYHIEVEIELRGEATASESSGRVRSRTLRQMVLDAADQLGIDRGSLRGKSGSDALVDWSDLIDELRDCILWDDRDYLAGETFLDLDPAVGDALKEQLGIAEDYFSAAPVEPTRAGLEEIRANLRRICRRPRAWGGDAVVGRDTTVPEACAQQIHDLLLVKPNRRG